MRLFLSKKQNKILLVVLSAMLFFASVLMVALSFRHVQGEIEYEEQYVVGDILSFQKYTFNVDGKDYVADSVLKTPDGQVSICNGTRFTTAGKHVLEYRKVIAGELYSKTYDLNVVDYLYSVSDTRSSAVYQDNVIYNYTNLEGESATHDTKTSGIVVSLRANSTFAYNKPIDLTKLDPTEPFISFTTLPSVFTERDMDDVIIVLTDIYDSTNKLYFSTNALTQQYGKSVWNETEAQAFFGTSMAELRAIREGAIAYGDTWYRYGYGTDFPFIGTWPTSRDDDGVMHYQSTPNIGEVFITYALDEVSGEVYGAHNTSLSHSEPYSTSTKETNYIATAFKDQTIYSNAWKGFTTGEVYLTMYCDKYQKDTANLLINKIGREDLSKQYFEGGTIPIVSVDLEGYSALSTPKAEVGKAYPLFNATGSSFYGEANVIPRVYYAYDSSTRSEVNVENNAFVPTREGSYAIFYEVSDAFGHTTSKRVNVTAKASLPEFNATFIDGYKTTAKTGELTSLAKINTAGGSGNTKISVKLTCGDFTDTITTTEYSFTKPGNYDVAYTVKDYLNNTKTLNYALTVSVNDSPVAQDALLLPETLIEGKTYNFPDYKFYDYSGDTVKTIDSVITVKDAEGTHVLSSNKYVVKGNDGKITVQYSAKIGAKETKLDEVDINVIDTVKEGETTKIDIKKYLQAYGNGEIVATETGIALKTTAGAGGFKFVNQLLANSFSVKVQVDPNNNKLSWVHVYLTDVVDENQRIKVSLFNNIEKGVANIYLNDKLTYGSISMNFNNGVLANMGYKNGKFTINGAEFSVGLLNYLNGNTFNGFSSGRVYLNVETEGVTKPANVYVSQINNQPIRVNTTMDSIAPNINILGSYVVSREPGEIITIYDAVISDVLDTNVSGTVTVIGPEGEPVTALDGTELSEAPIKEYKVRLDQYGNYKITYESIDSKTRSKEVISIGVYDFVAPEITVSKSLPTKVKLNSKISVPTATATDNNDQASDIKIEVYVRNPNGVMLPLKKMQSSGENYYSIVGTYEISYLAYDLSGNLALKTYQVTVTK